MFTPPSLPVRPPTPWRPPLEPEETQGPIKLGLQPPWVDQKDWGTPPNCRPGSEAKNGVCEPTFTCPSGFSRNGRTGWCDPVSTTEYNCNESDMNNKPFCGPDAYYSRAQGRCIPCPCQLSKGWSVNPRGEGCVFRYAGKPCCPGQGPMAPCPISDRVWNEKGECVGAPLPHCEHLYGAHARYNADTGRCECEPGYIRDEVARACVEDKGGELPPAPASGSSSSAGKVVAVGLTLVTVVGLAVAWKRWQEKHGRNETTDESRMRATSSRISP